MIYRLRSNVPLIALTFLFVGKSPGAAPPLVVGFERFHASSKTPSIEGGRLLLSELGCVACHRGNRNTEIKTGPVLSDVTHRLREPWLRRFIAQPSTAKPGTTMPDLFSHLNGQERSAAVEALIHFLGTLHSPMRSPAASIAGDAERGESLYHHVGCVACHAPDPRHENTKGMVSEVERRLADLGLEEELNEYRRRNQAPSIPHADLAEKYRPAALTEFLVDPLRFRPSGRMPSLRLSEQEAADLTAYLTKRLVQTTPETVVDAKLAEQGRELFRSTGCVNCHAVSGIEPIDSPALEALANRDDSGCLARESHRTPVWSFSETQRAALRSALRHATDLPITTGPERVDTAMTVFNCYGCHERDKKGGVASGRWQYFETVRNIDLGDEGRIPPSLTGVGRKLKAQWLAEVFDGTGNVRPHLLARMPVFGAANVGHMPAHFVAADSVPRKPAERSPPKADVDAGRKLLATGCIQCHPIRGRAMPGVLGVDLNRVDRRLNDFWFREFLRNPASLKPGTRMPTFFPNNVSTVPSVLDGDVDDQIESMWAYLSQPDAFALPEALLEKSSYVLTPTERPIVLRTFLKDVSPRAVAVGFPQQLNVVFDAEEARWAIAWRGRFLDAHGTWFDRFAPPAEPLGTDLFNFPSAPMLAAITSANEPWPTNRKERSGAIFRGYRLDAMRVPTFLYDLEGCRVEDRIQPMANGNGFSRTVRIDRILPNAWLRLLADDSITLKPGRFGDAEGWSVHAHGEMASRAILRSTREGKEVILPLGDQRVIELEYEWRAGNVD